MDVVVDRAGNQWGWWGNPDETPGVVIGSHLDSVADGGAFDGPLGVVSSFAALDALQHKGFRPRVPIGVASHADGLAAAVAASVRDVTKLRADVLLAAPGSLPNDGKVIEDARSYS